MNNLVFLLVAALLLASAPSSGSARDLDAELWSVPSVPGLPPSTAPEGKVPTAGFPGASGFGVPGGGGFGVPGWGGDGNGIPGFPGGWGGSGWGNMGGGWGAGYGGPSGGYGKGGIVRPSVVCSERGPCYKKKLTCPAKCFTSYSRSGKNYGGGGGGGGEGGCTIDCKRCVAYC